MKRFLPLLHGAGLGQHRKLLTETISSELVGFLLKVGLLRSDGAAEWWPCGDYGAMGDGCPRAIVPSGRADAPLLAVCGSSWGCEDVPLQEADREILAPDFERFYGMLERLVHAEGSDRSERFPDTVRLGVSRRDGTAREVFFAQHALVEPMLSSFVTVRRVAPDPTLLFVLSAKHVPVTLAAQCGPRDKVEIVALDEALEWHDGRVGLRWPRVLPSVVALTDGAPAFVTLGHDGERRLSPEAYTALLAAAPETLDLLLDMTTVVTGKRKGRYRAGVRKAGGWTEVELLADHAEALAELVERRGTFLMPRELRCNAQRGAGENAAALQRFQVARAQLDEAPWRLFPTQPGSRERDLAYAFEPPPDFRFAVVRRLG